MAGIIDFAYRAEAVTNANVIREWSLSIIAARDFEHPLHMTVGGPGPWLTLSNCAPLRTRLRST
jgi:hypothetical protein